MRTLRLVLAATLSGCLTTTAVGQAKSEPPKLTHAAWLQALDSSLAFVRIQAKAIFVNASEGQPPFSPADLQARHIGLRLNRSVCPGEAVLAFRRPKRLPDGRIVLDVVMELGTHGLAGVESFLFECRDGSCVLVDAAPKEEDVLVGCPG